MALQSHPGPFEQGASNADLRDRTENVPQPPEHSLRRRFRDGGSVGRPSPCGAPLPSRRSNRAAGPAPSAGSPSPRESHDRRGNGRLQGKSRPRGGGGGRGKGRQKSQMEFRRHEGGDFPGHHSRIRQAMKKRAGNIRVPHPGAAGIPCTGVDLQSPVSGADGGQPSISPVRVPFISPRAAKAGDF